MKEENESWIFYGWVVVLIGALTMLLNYTIRYSYAVFMPTLQDTFGWSRTNTRFAYTLQLLCYGMAAPLVGSLFDKYGPRRLFPIGAGFILAALLLCSQIRELWQRRPSALWGV